MTNKKSKNPVVASLIEQAKKELGRAFETLDPEIKKELEEIDKLRNLSNELSLSPEDLLPA